MLNLIKLANIISKYSKYYKKLLILNILKKFKIFTTQKNLIKSYLKEKTIILIFFYITHLLFVSIIIFISILILILKYYDIILSINDIIYNIYTILNLVLTEQNMILNNNINSKLSFI